MTNNSIDDNAVNRSDIITSMTSKRPDLGEVIIDESVREIIQLMTDTLVNEGRIEVREFGSFSLHYREPRVGRNPRTGESVQVGKKAVPHFKPSKALREAVNEQFK